MARKWLTVNIDLETKKRLKLISEKSQRSMNSMVSWLIYREYERCVRDEQVKASDGIPERVT